MINKELINTIRNQLKIDEGYRKHIYLCDAGERTIGFGRNLDDVGISLKEAEILLDNDIVIAVNAAESAIRNFNELSDNHKAVIVNMIFNIGASRFRLFKRFIEAIERNDFAKAAIEMIDSRWYEQVGARAKRLVEKMKDE